MTAATFETGRVDIETTALVEWEDEDLNDGEWPYPTKYARRIIEGPLANAVRIRLKAEPDDAVEITETVTSGGYSEWTQENDCAMTISCGGIDVEFNRYDAAANMTGLLEWLDGGAA